MIENLSSLSKQHLRALYDIRQDAIGYTAKELQQLISECDDIRKELQTRGDEQDA